MHIYAEQYSARKSDCNSIKCRVTYTFLIQTFFSLYIYIINIYRDRIKTMGTDHKTKFPNPIKQKSLKTELSNNGHNTICLRGIILDVGSNVITNQRMANWTRGDLCWYTKIAPITKTPTEKMNCQSINVVNKDISGSKFRFKGKNSFRR